MYPIFTSVLIRIIDNGVDMEQLQASILLRCKMVVEDTLYTLNEISASSTRVTPITFILGMVSRG